jgi:flagellar M-ring protein FliF
MADKPMAEGKPQTFDDFMGRLREFYKGLSFRQRLWIGIGAAAVAGTLWLFVALLGQPKYVTLYSGMRGEDAQAMGAKLAAKGIAHQVSPDGGTLLVPEDKLDAARLETAAAGLPRGARMGFELFDTPNWAGSDFTEKVNYQRALEGELERTLGTLSEVEAVRVHLVMPEESLFTEQERAAKAAVILKTRTGRLSEQAQLAIPQLVASAVDRLKPENVTVVDADSNTPLIHGPDGARVYAPDEELAKTLIHTLEPVVGADHVRASVHVEYDLGTSEEMQETYDPKTPTPLTEEHSEESSTGEAPAGVPGTASNVPAATAAGGTNGATNKSSNNSTTPNSSSTTTNNTATNPPAIPAIGPGAEHSVSKSDATTYAVSKSTHRSVEPAGRVRRVAAAVLVDDAVEWTMQAGKRTSTRRKRTTDEMKQIEELARAAIGIDTQRGDVLAVENLSFQETPLEAPPTPTKVDKWRKLLELWAWTLRYVALGALFLVVYWLVLRPVKKQALAAFRSQPKEIAAGGVPALAAGESAEKNEELPEGQRVKELKQILTEKVKAQPESASRLIEGWVREEQQG